jgi:hypothetical protein
MWLTVIVLSGCVSQVRVDQQFPKVVSEPRDLTVALVLDGEFRSYQAHPNEKTRIQFGASQVDLMTKAFKGLFARVNVVSPNDPIGADTDLVVKPSVSQVQLSSPSQSYLNVYEVWIKYSLDIRTADGVAIDSWFLPAYGKTPYSSLLSRSRAIETATVIALRDAGAKLLLDFYRIPAVYGWLEQREKARAES